MYENNKYTKYVYDTINRHEALDCLPLKKNPNSFSIQFVFIESKLDQTV